MDLLKPFSASDKMTMAFLFKFIKMINLVMDSWLWNYLGVSGIKPTWRRGWYVWYAPAFLCFVFSLLLFTKDTDL